jgi:hypothetical protein
MLTPQAVLSSWRKRQIEVAGKLLTKRSRYQTKRRAIDLFGEVLSKHGWTRAEGSYKAVYLHANAGFVVKLTAAAPDEGGLYNPRHGVFLSYIHLDRSGVLGLQATASTQRARTAARLLSGKLWKQRKSLRVSDKALGIIRDTRDYDGDEPGGLAWAYDMHADNCGWVRGRPVCFDPINPEFVP